MAQSHPWLLAHLGVPPQELNAEVARLKAPGADTGESPEPTEQVWATALSGRSICGWASCGKKTPKNGRMPAWSGSPTMLCVTEA